MRPTAGWSVPGVDRNNTGGAHFLSAADTGGSCRTEQGDHAEGGDGQFQGCAGSFHVLSPARCGPAFLLPSLYGDRMWQAEDRLMAICVIRVTKSAPVAVRAFRWNDGENLLRCIQMTEQHLRADSGCARGTCQRCCVCRRAPGIEFRRGKRAERKGHDCDGSESDFGIRQFKSSGGGFCPPNPEKPVIRLYARISGRSSRLTLDGHRNRDLNPDGKYFFFFG